MKYVIKRDGRRKDFDRDKVEAAILKAFIAVDGQEVSDYAKDKAKHIADYIAGIDKDEVFVEEVQDIVEKGLMATKRKDVAKAYILYREDRTKARGNTTDKAIMDLLCGDSDYWNTENSNKDAAVVTTQRDYLAGIASTDIARRKLLPKEVCDAHDAGIIHQHDVDYMAQNALTNCCLINLEDMLQNGTVINGVQIEPQNRLITATTVATQIITAVASSQYGGTTISLTHLAPYVRKSFARHYKTGLEFFYSPEVANSADISDTYPMSSPVYLKNITAYNYAKAMVQKEISDSVQTFNYQINSMSTTNGQAPFLSVLMYLEEAGDYKDELAMLTMEFLQQRIKGLKNEKGVYITQSFPKLLYVLDEDNITPDSPYYHITEKAAECTAKRLVPDYISAKVMKENKVNYMGHGDVYGCMGCRSFLTPDRTTKNYARALNYDASKGKYYGRFNMGVTTLNLADVALSSGKDFDKFWEILDERAELCRIGLQARIKRLENVTSDVAPILWQNGAYARLDKGEKLYDLIHNGYSTASLGYAALYECVKYMTGHSHSDAEGESFALELMQKLNDKCAAWKAEENIDYSLYGSPIESVTYKFAKTLKQRFGSDVFIELDGKDRAYITNSYHIPVFEEIDAFSKLAQESKFQKLSPGGAISYIECSDLSKNNDAVMQVLKFIYDNIMYAELNTKSDFCQECDYTGEILIDEDMEWYCPQCGNRDHSKLNVARRTCGYIGAHFWNYGRTEEIKDRYIHLGE